MEASYEGGLSLEGAVASWMVGINARNMGHIKVTIQFIC